MYRRPLPSFTWYLLPCGCRKWGGKKKNAAVCICVYYSAVVQPYSMGPYVCLHIQGQLSVHEWVISETPPPVVVYNTLSICLSSWVAGFPPSKSAAWLSSPAFYVSGLQRPVSS